MCDIHMDHLPTLGENMTILKEEKHRYNIPYLHGGSIWDSDSASRLNRSSQLIQGLGEFFGGDAMFAYQTRDTQKKKANYLNPPNKKSLHL